MNRYLFSDQSLCRICSKDRGDDESLCVKCRGTYTYLKESAAGRNYELGLDEHIRMSKYMMAEIKRSGIWDDMIKTKAKINEPL